MAIIPTDPAASETMKVHLKGLDELGSAKWAHPLTEVECLGGTFTSGIVSSGNILTFDAASAGVPTSAAMSSYVSGSYCPLTKVISGTTYYADLYTTGGSATVTPVPGSTGYGTLDNEYSVVNVIASPYDSKAIPTEAAVASALETKQHLLSAGGYVSMTSGAVADRITVSAAVEIRPVGSAEHAALATEGAVASALDGLNTTINNSGFALSSWVLNNFWQKGETPSSGGGSGDWSYATTSSAGVVMPISNGGLVVGAGGSLSLATATTGSKGGVICGTGLEMSGTNNAYIRLHVASGNALGGVYVPASSGLTLNSANGMLVLSKAPVTSSSYASAVTSLGSGRIGGVIVMDHIESSNATHASQPVVPTVNAVYNADSNTSAWASSNFQPIYGGPFAVTQNEDNANQYDVNSGYIYANGSRYLVNGQQNVSATSGSQIYMVISSGSGAITSSFINSYASNTQDTLVVKLATVAGAYVEQHQFGDLEYGQFGGGYTGPFRVSSNGLNPYSGIDCVVTPGMYYAGTTSGAVLGLPANSVFISSGMALYLKIETSSGYDCSYVNTVPASPAAGDVYVMLASNNSGTLEQKQFGHVFIPGAVSGGSSYTFSNGLTETNGTVTLNSAGYNSFGGVVVAENKGIGIGDGVVSMAAAAVVDTYASAYTKAGSGNVGGVVVMSNIASTSDEYAASSPIVPTVQAVYDYVSASGGGNAAYAGPFAASYSGTATTVVNVSGGYVKWLDGNTFVSGTSNLSVSSGGFVYLVGSSGAAAGEKITASSYSATILYSSGSSSATYTRKTTSALYSGGTRFLWSGAQGSMWAPQDLGVGTPVYNSSTDEEANSKGYVTAYRGTITVGGKLYSRTSTDNMNTMGWYSSGAVKYTASAWPLSGQSTLYSISSAFAYATAEPGLPPSGAFYTMLAQNSGGSMTQHQYGTVWHEHWGDDYRGQFAMSRVARITLSATTTMSAGTYPYKYIVGNGGRVYGGIKFAHGRIWAGYITSGGVVLAPGDIQYPSVTVKSPGTINASNVYTDASTSGTSSDGLYIPYGTTAEVWLNIWSGTWPTAYGGNATQAVTSTWYTVVHSLCLEGYIPNCYSVQLGWLTPNGAPQQEHRGAISIRGRWT